ncbi:hypothetical protein Ga0100231_000560 [Opitutaceae bacterium TAV4]|nr:hypothetical protein Ga0100231_021885 [Opitutaceae bacterium TAV4]RRK01343.1 hypothetical protein Ga0100231_000560 [Opitutaceae bacterium TAV4]RRK01623.1 hypothetical protein Ga0100230_007215 [Opitutaceae bacterium TAV3]
MRQLVIIFILIQLPNICFGEHAKHPLFDHNLNYDERARASYISSEQLILDFVQQLIGFLGQIPTQDKNQEDELASLKNNVTDSLLRMDVLPAGFTNTLISLFEDTHQGVIWREYIVQKIPEVIGKVQGDDRKTALGFLRKVSESTDYAYAGTALIGLDRLYGSHPDLISPDEIARRARAVLISEQHSEASKISALQVLASHDAPAALTHSRSFLQGQSPVMLKISALATLGVVGKTEDRTLIERYAKSPEFRLRTAARAALRQPVFKVNLRANE